MGVRSRIAAVVRRKIDFQSTSPMVSFSFDDAPLSSFTVGGKILEEHGFRGTYYVSAGLFQKMTNVGRIVDLNTVNAFRARGHEIGNHTFEHMDCAKAGLFSIVRSIRRNRRNLTGIMSGSFAYPYGSRDDKARVAVRLCTTSARGISFGINRGVIDFMDLKAIRVYHQNGIGACLDLVRECASRGGWLIFYTHDIREDPSEYGCTPEQWTYLVGSVHEKKLPVATIGRAAEVLLNRSGEKKIS